MTPLLVKPDFAKLSDAAVSKFLRRHIDYVTPDDLVASREERATTAALVFDRMFEDFGAGLARADELNAEANAASKALAPFPRGPMGLTPDAVKTSPEFREAAARYDRAHQALRAFNGPFVKRFSLELSEHRQAARLAKIAQSA